MHISFGRARALDAGVWTGTLSHAEARRLPGAPLKIAGPHVVVLREPVWNGEELKAPFEGVSVVALGADETAIFLRASAPTANAPGGAQAHQADQKRVASPAPAATGDGALGQEPNDDAAFVADCEGISPEMVRTAKALIARVRAIYQGRLSRQTNPRQFAETPDNFWSVEVQPRRGAIKLVVRTSETALLRAGLAYESERPPSYWAMKIYGDQDVETALRFLAVGTRTPNK